MYYTKEECYQDTLISLRFGTVEVEDLRHLISYYKELEHYECCAGIVEAYSQFETEKKYAEENQEISGERVFNRRFSSED